MSVQSQRSKDKLFLIVLLIHVVVCLGYALATDHVHAIWPGIIAVLASYTAYVFKPGTLFSRSVMAISLVVFSATLIHLSGGLIEMHFHIFASLALLTIYYDWRIIVIGAAAIAVHHLYGLVTDIYTVYAPNPNLVIYFLHVLFVVLESAVLCYLCETSRRSTLTIKTQNNKLTQALKEIEVKRQLEEKVAGQMEMVTGELNISANNQASGAAEQSSAVISATTSMEELGWNAAQIAENSQKVADSAVQTLQIAHEVQEISQRADDLAAQGQQSVQDTITSVEHLRHRIELLGQRLLVLTDRSKQIGAIIDLLNSIADETHLLALNAAIESAGAGEYGQRFGVIANEVKSLADRSIAATQEVRVVIAELQGAVAASVLVAEEGKKETIHAVEKSYRSGLAIDAIGKVAKLNSEKGEQILSYTEIVNQFVTEISYATRQQQSSSEQVIGTLHALSTVARDAASGSQQVISSARHLSELSLQLKETFSS